MTTQTGTLTMGISGVWLTNHCRELFYEGNCIHAFRTLEEGLQGMKREYAKNIILGKAKITEQMEYKSDDQPMDTRFILKNLKERFIKNEFLLWAKTLNSIFEGEKPSVDLVYDLRQKASETMKEFEFLIELDVISDEYIQSIQEELKEQIDEVLTATYHVESVAFWYARKMFTDYLIGGGLRKVLQIGQTEAIERNDKRRAMPKPPKSTYETMMDSGWLLPDGSFYPCEYEGHIRLIGVMFESGIIDTTKEKDLEKMGWVKISRERIRYHFHDRRRKLTKKQKNFIYDFAIHRNLDIMEINHSKIKRGEIYEVLDRGW